MKRITEINQVQWVVLSLVIFLVAGGKSIAQKSYELTSAQEFKLSGTSTLHDWEMLSGTGKGTAAVVLSAQTIKSVSTLMVTLPAVSLKSGKESMDKNAYKALEATQYPNIHFELTEVETITSKQIKGKGKITIAGTSRVIPIDVSYKVFENTILFTGELAITFTQFNIDPPKALLGTIKTGNELQISFETTFKSTNQIRSHEKSKYMVYYNCACPDACSIKYGVWTTVCIAIF